MERGYRELPHTADVALEVWGRNLEELFVHAARGLSGLLATVEPGAAVAAQRQIDLSAPDAETLLVDWLNELLLLYDEHGEAFVSFDLSLHDDELSARVGATRAFAPIRTVKAATFHDLAIRHDAQGYRTTIVFDV